MFHEPQISVLDVLSAKFNNNVHYGFGQFYDSTVGRLFRESKCFTGGNEKLTKDDDPSENQGQLTPLSSGSAVTLIASSDGIFPFGSNGSNGGDPDNKKRREVMANIIGGCVQATLVTLTGYPFDLVKSRLQSGMYPDSISCIKGTVRNEGFLGLYRGSAMPWLSHMLKRPVQYPISEYFKKKVGESGVTKSENTFYNYLIGGATGLLGPIFGTPLQVVKVSMQTSSRSTLDLSQNVKPKNSWEYIRYNYKKNGVRGFYRGFIPTALKDSMYGASFIGTYYTLRDAIGTDAWYKNFFSGATAHCVTWCVFMPIDYVKTAVQKSETKVGILDVVKTSYKAHGVTVFWRGVVPACLRTIPVSGVAMMGYESIRSLIMDDKK